MDKESIQLEPMRAGDIDAAVELVRKAMNEHEAAWARTTLEFHFACAARGLDDSRSYLLYRENERLLGVVGLHKYIWGPPENVWLAWFAVHPDCHGRGVGGRLVDYVEMLARRAGCRKFFVETYDSTAFDKARSFYLKKGFVEAGRIADYLPDGSSMVVYRKSLSP